MKIKTPDFLPPDRIEIDMIIDELKKKSSNKEEATSK